MSNILITGTGKGLGKAMKEELEKQGHSIIDYNLEDGNDVRTTKDLIMWENIDVLINNAGVNLIDWLENFEEDMWDKVMDTNAKGIYMMTKACLPSLIRRKGTILNIVSNAAHMPMTCSLAYNASKGAAHIMTLQLARELTKKHGITVFGIAPNKLKGTGMSDAIDDQVVKTRGWTKEYAQQYQLNGLLTGEETPPQRLAEFVAFLLQSKEHHKYLTGCILPYGA
jgi:NAD(P)-dependent dehydrogenase (short-subunit alcohol dehydrogenase family)|tara:strand:- start:765 stop:1439 length:675 start_codon:yes stop_codon:yes gene_type:complete